MVFDSVRVNLITLWIGYYRVMGDVSECLRDTFGMAGDGYSEPFERGVESLRCEFEDIDPTTLKKFVLNYYPDAKTFADWNGTDMNPERHSEYPEHSRLSKCRPWEPGKNGPPQTERVNT